jgi:pimeloyl-ACP methyl ester carboxylesterase
LIEASLNEPMQALQMVNVFSRATLAAPPSALGPGTWVYGASMALGRRVLASNPKVNLFHRGFVACDSYTNGLSAIAAITCPVLFLLGESDQMTPPRAAKGLIDQAQTSGKTLQVVQVPMGHHQMSESPEETLHALKSFLGL